MEDWTRKQQTYLALVLRHVQLVVLLLFLRVPGTRFDHVLFRGSPEAITIAPEWPDGLVLLSWGFAGTSLGKAPSFWGSHFEIQPFVLDLPAFWKQLDQRNQVRDIAEAARFRTHPLAGAFHVKQPTPLLSGGCSFWLSSATPELVVWIGSFRNETRVSKPRSSKPPRGKVTIFLRLGSWAYSRWQRLIGLGPPVPFLTPFWVGRVPLLT